MYDSMDGTFLEHQFEKPRSKINPYHELLKCLFGMNRKYTLPVLALGILEEWYSIEKHLPYFEASIERLKTDLNQLLGKNAVLLCPTFPEVGKL